MLFAPITAVSFNYGLKKMILVQFVYGFGFHDLKALVLALSCSFGFSFFGVYGFGYEVFCALMNRITRKEAVLISVLCFNFWFQLMIWALIGAAGFMVLVLWYFGLKIG